MKLSILITKIEPVDQITFAAKLAEQNHKVIAEGVYLIFHTILKEDLVKIIGEQLQQPRSICIYELEGRFSGLGLGIESETALRAIFSK